MLQDQFGIGANLVKQVQRSETETDEGQPMTTKATMKCAYR